MSIRAEDYDAAVIVLLNSLPEDRLTTIRETLEGAEDSRFASRMMSNLMPGNIQAAGIGGASDNIFVLTFQFITQIEEAISAMREHQCDNTSTENESYIMMPLHVLRMGESIVDIFHSDSDPHKNIILQAFSDSFEDFSLGEMHRTPLCCCTLELFTRVLDCQGRLGGEHLVRGLNKTIIVGEMIKKRCTYLLARCGDIINQDKKAQCIKQLVFYAKVALRTFFQVGERQRFGYQIRTYSKYADITLFGLPRDFDVSSSTADDEIWRHQKKVGLHPLAFINYGAYEESGGDVAKKHNKCSRCFNALYCSKECQLKHWEQHKMICKEISKEKKASRSGKSPK